MSQITIDHNPSAEKLKELGVSSWSIWDCVVVKLAGRTADDATYEKLHELAQRETSTEQKRLLYNALAGSLNPRHAGKTLALAITDELIPTAATRLVNTVATDGEQTAAAWKFAEPNLAVLHAKLSALGTNGYVAGLFSAFTDAARADELEAFAKAKLPLEAQYEVSKAADEIRFHAELKARVLPEIDAWIRTKLAP